MDLKIGNIYLYYDTKDSIPIKVKITSIKHRRTYNDNLIQFKYQDIFGYGCSIQPLKFKSMTYLRKEKLQKINALQPDIREFMLIHRR